MPRPMPLVLLALLGLVLAGRGGAALAAPVMPPVMPPLDPGGACRAAIAAAERSFGIPAGLLAAIGVVESGRRGTDGRLTPWPWSIDAEGSGQVFPTKAAAIAAVQALQARGVRSIDVGCMQVNLLHHPDAFARLDDAFDPARNVAYAARFLLRLHAAAGAWPAAAALYHSATPALGADYQRKVLAVWSGAPADAARAAATALPGAAWGMPVAAVGGIAPGGGLAGGLLRRVAAPPRPLPLRAGPTGRGLAAYRAAPIPLALTLFALPRRRE